jgi:hypothetical protein
MFSLKEKQHIAAEIEKLLLAINHPEMPKRHPRFRLHVDGAESWSWADIEPNWTFETKAPAVNPWNEQDHKTIAEEAPKISVVLGSSSEPHPLTADNVEDIFMDCLACHGELTEAQENWIRSGGDLPPGWVKITGLMMAAVLNEQRLKDNAGKIREMLEQLPEQFREERGGGWSFLNACMTADGRQWGEHRDIDRLLVLGIGCGQAKIVPIRKEFWPLLLGGMPYFSVIAQPASTSK